MWRSPHQHASLDEESKEQVHEELLSSTEIITRDIVTKFEEDTPSESISVRNLMTLIFVNNSTLEKNVVVITHKNEGSQRYQALHP